MTDPELLEVANKMKAKGNDKFKAKEYKDAVDCYLDAIEHLDKMTL